MNEPRHYSSLDRALAPVQRALGATLGPAPPAPFLRNAFTRLSESSTGKNPAPAAVLRMRSAGC